MSALEGIDFTDDEWLEYQSIPDQGYSHRHWLDQRNRKIMARLLADAWEAGYEAGDSDRYWDKGATRNPHREDTA